MVKGHSCTQCYKGDKGGTAEKTKSEIVLLRFLISWEYNFMIPILSGFPGQARE
jgi:hypothetical protein